MNHLFLNQAVQVPSLFYGSFEEDRLYVFDTDPGMK